MEGERPEIPHTLAAAPGLWAIVRRCWREDPAARPPLFEIRDSLFIAAGLWNTDLDQSESTDGYVSIPRDTLLSSGDFYDTGKRETSPFIDACVHALLESDSESESGMSLCSSVQRSRTSPRMVTHFHIFDIHESSVAPGLCFRAKCSGSNPIRWRSRANRRRRPVQR